MAELKTYLALTADMKIECVDTERPKCATLNCTREGNALNIVRGKLDLSPASDGKGPSIWVDAYLCDFCAERLAQALPPYANKPLGLMEVHKCLE